MSPVEKFRQLSDTTRVSLPITVFIAALACTSGAVGAGYAARDQAVTQINNTIKTNADAQKVETQQLVAAERVRSDERYMTRLEFAQKVLPALAEMRADMKLLTRERRR